MSSDLAKISTASWPVIRMNKGGHRAKSTRANITVCREGVHRPDAILLDEHIVDCPLEEGLVESIVVYHQEVQGD
jgi:hypothetical protein